MKQLVELVHIALIPFNLFIPQYATLFLYLVLSSVSLHQTSPSKNFMWQTSIIFLSAFHSLNACKSGCSKHCFDVQHGRSSGYCRNHKKTNSSHKNCLWRLTRATWHKSIAINFYCVSLLCSCVDSFHQHAKHYNVGQICCLQQWEWGVTWWIWWCAVRGAAFMDDFHWSNYLCPTVVLLHRQQI